VAKGPLTFVVLDPRYEERLRMIFGPTVDTLVADEHRAPTRLDAGEPVLVSRAARRFCGPLSVEHMLPPEIPVIAPDCARELAHWLVHLNLASEPAQWRSPLPTEAGFPSPGGTRRGGVRRDRGCNHVREPEAHSADSLR